MKVARAYVQQVECVWTQQDVRKRPPRLDRIQVLDLELRQNNIQRDKSLVSQDKGEARLKNVAQRGSDRNIESKMYLYKRCKGK